MHKHLCGVDSMLKLPNMTDCTINKSGHLQSVTLKKDELVQLAKKAYSQKSYLYEQFLPELKDNCPVNLHPSNSLQDSLQK